MSGFRVERFSVDIVEPIEKRLTAPVYGIQKAAWLWAEQEDDGRPPHVVRFRLDRKLETDSRFTFHLSADQTYELFVDGEFVLRGPRLSDPDHQAFDSLRFELSKGLHTLEVVARHLPPGIRPAVRMSVAPGFVLSSEAGEEGLFDTGSAPWKVCVVRGLSFAPADPSAFTCFVAGGAETLDASLFYTDGPWRDPVVTDPPLSGEFCWGLVGTRRKIHPAPPATVPGGAVPPGRVRSFGTDLPLSSLPFLGPIGSERESVSAADALSSVGHGGYVLFDLESYRRGRPVLKVSGGEGAVLEIGWSEAMYDKPDLKGSKGHRDAASGKFFMGVRDAFVLDGKNRMLTTREWRSGRYLLLRVIPGSTPVQSLDLSVETEPSEFSDDGAFSARDDASLGRIQRMCSETLGACLGETAMDSPYYERLQYTADARLQLLCFYTACGDGNYPLRLLELMAWSARETGWIAERYPADPHQLSDVYSLFFPLALRDLFLYRDVPETRFGRLAIEARRLFELCRTRETPDGLLGRLAGWSVLDWAEGWKYGVPPGVDAGVPSCPINLLYVNALLAQAELEEWLGRSETARTYRACALRTYKRIDGLFWDEPAGAYADDPAHAAWSEHSQALALHCGLPDPDRAERLLNLLAASRTAGDLKLMEVPTGDPFAEYRSLRLTRCSLQFSHYLLEAFARYGRGNDLVSAFQPWKDLIALGFLTTPETDDVRQTRSDCHGWSAHPFYHFRTHLLGIAPDSPAFSSVIVRPVPGPLREVSGRIPHPRGFIEARLRFGENGRCSGFVRLPEGIPGRFVWRDHEIRLSAGTATEIG